MKKYVAVITALLVTVLTAQDVYRANDSTFVYPCIASDSTTSLNFVGLPLETGWTMASDIDPDGTNIDAVSKWDIVNQVWETVGYHAVLGWITDFPVETGDALMINARNDFDFVVEGDSVDVVYNLITTDGTDQNPISVPLSKAGLATTETLGDDIGFCNAIAKYNNSTQQFETSSYSSVFGWLNIFPVEPGMPLFANVSEAVSWPSVTKYKTGSKNSNSKLAGAVPRVFYYHVTDENGNDYDFTASPYDSIEFECYIPYRPGEIINQDTPGCGYAMLGGMYSVIYFNPGNFITPWQSGDPISIKVMDKSRYVEMYDDYASAYDELTLDPSAAPVIKGVESLIPGSGLALAISMPSGVEEDNIPDQTVLHQNYPNPFNPETVISLSLPREEQVTLSVFNMNGQLVKELVNGMVSAGNHSINFNASDLNSGIYFYTLETGSTKLSRKMLLVK